MSVLNQVASVFVDATPAVNTPSVTQPTIGRPHIYVLPTFDGSRMKIGRSTDPLGRISGLIRQHPEIDLGRAVIIAIDTLSVEKIVHTVFESQRNPLSKRMDGYTEWFDGDFVEQVISLCHTVAAHRGAQIQVTRNLSEILRTYLLQNPAHLLPTPRLSRIERENCVLLAIEHMSRLAKEGAQRFIGVMGERELFHTRDNLGYHYLVREFCMIDEPVCRPQNATAWGIHLRAAGEISINVEGNQAVFHLVKPSICREADSQRCREYFRIAQGPTESSLAGGYDVSAAAFDLLWHAVQVLPEMTCGEVL